MKYKTLKYISFVGVFIFLIACSVKKDKFINRNFHALTTEYNVLYNGNLALESGLTDLVATYKDNFWETLPVERMPDSEENLLPGDSKNPNFERAEEKAVKAIQKHSMNIAGTERNPQMDEAYLLLAKARYYDNRFIPALEALNYILYKYPKSDRIYHAKVWREKVNIRIENNEVAIQNLKKLLENNNLEGQDLADANAMLTQAYLNIGVSDTAIATIKIAKEATQVKEEKARYTFILGQLYEAANFQDSAYNAFQEVIDMKRKSPRRYVIQAHARQALQFDYEKGDTLAFVEKFNKLIEDRENRPFLDVLYHQMGIFYDKNEKDAIAKKFYNKSIQSYSEDGYLISSNYRNIGDIYFKDAAYKTAGMYYDSTLLRMNNRTREYRLIKKKRENLVDVIYYEDIATKNDSILTIVAMNDSDRTKYYEKHIVELKAEDEKKAKIAAELAEKEKNKLQNEVASNPLGGKINNAVMTPANIGITPPGSIKGGQQSNFYFYNPTTVSYGKNEFVKKWGKRNLKENWRLLSNKDNDFASDDSDNLSNDSNDSIQLVEENPLYSVSYYTKQLPTEQKAIDSISKDRNFAYYQLGLIYKEKFKEYQLAANRLETLLKNNPEERLVLPAKYNLYKIYEIINPSKALVYKNDIISNYPDSRYAQIVQNPLAQTNDDESPEAVYKRLYKKYQDGELRDAFEEVNQRVDDYLGDESLSKFEMLKASLIGRLKGLEEYKKALTYVSLTYPNENEGKIAESLIQNDIPKLEALVFIPGEGTSYKMIFTKDVAANENKEVLIKKLKKYLEDRHNDDLKLSVDVYNLDKDFIVIHGFITKETAQSILSVLKEYKEYKIKDKAYIISAEDYKVIQIKKQFDDWLILNN